MESVTDEWDREIVRVFQRSHMSYYIVSQLDLYSRHRLIGWFCSSLAFIRFLYPTACVQADGDIGSMPVAAAVE